VAVGQLSYFLYALSCLGVVLAISVPGDANSITPWLLLKSSAILLYDIVTGRWAPVLQNVKRALATPWIVVVLPCAFGLSAALAVYAYRLRNATFSRFWHKSRQELRSALKEAKVMAAASR
jgi:hypothetical protein